jgi:hypothetical protein
MEARRQPLRRKGWNHADEQREPPLLAGDPRRVESLAQPVEEFGHREGERRPRSRRRDRPVHAFEELRAEIALEHGDLMADRRRGNGELAGGALEAAEAGDRLERTKRAKRRRNEGS